MKKILLIISMTGISYTGNPYYSNNINNQPKKVITVQKTDLVVFLDTLGFKESTNDYTRVNKWGHLGKYQFSKKTLRGLEYKVTPQQFLDNPELQEQAVRDLLIENKRIMRKFITKYEGTIINGITITESGILAATHLVGPRAVKRYLNSNGKRIKKDALGTSIEDYMKLMGGYDLKL